MRLRSLCLLLIAAALASCSVRTTPDGGIAVVPTAPQSVSVKSLVTQPEPSPAAPSGQCSPATIVYKEWLAASIVGQQKGSRVNVRPQPDLSTTSGSYGLVGDQVGVMGETIGGSCDRWFHVHFPATAHRGYISADFVDIKE